MTRRKYDMGRRGEAVEHTRRRILEATMAIHDEQGIVDASWPDIAELAGVSLATVYRHFPTLEELVTACGKLTLERIVPPTVESATEIFSGADSHDDRVERLVRETFAFYERAGRIVENVRRERERLAVLRDAHERFRSGLDALVDEALRPYGATPDQVRLVRALTDVRAWEAAREHGLDAEGAIGAVLRMLLCVLPPRGHPDTEELLRA